MKCCKKKHNIQLNFYYVLRNELFSKFISGPMSENVEVLLYKRLLIHYVIRNHNLIYISYGFEYIKSMNAEGLIRKLWNIVDRYARKLHMVIRLIAGFYHMCAHELTCT